MTDRLNEIKAHWLEHGRAGPFDVPWLVTEIERLRSLEGLVSDLAIVAAMDFDDLNVEALLDAFRKRAAQLMAVLS